MANNDMTPCRVSLPALLAVLLPVSISTLEISLTSTALPAIAWAIDEVSATSIWVVNVYYLVVVAALLPLAAIGEIFGHRRVFTAGIIIFVAESLACGLAWSLPTLLAARALLALSAAAVLGLRLSRSGADPSALPTDTVWA